MLGEEPQPCQAPETGTRAGKIPGHRVLCTHLSVMRHSSCFTAFSVAPFL
jgi:hypothetical protein